MDNKKDDLYYAGKIRDDLRFIVGHTKGITVGDLEENEILVDSVMFRMIQISENSDKLTADFKERYGSIPWRAIKGMRNRIVHNYGGVDMTVVFDTVMYDIPELLSELEGISDSTP